MWRFCWWWKRKSWVSTGCNFVLNIATFVLGHQIQNASWIALQQKLLSLCPSPLAKVPLIYLIFGRLTLPKYQKEHYPSGDGGQAHACFIYVFMNWKPAPARNKEDNKKLVMNSRQNWDPHATGLHSNIRHFFLVSGFFSGRFHRVAMNSGSRIFFEKHQPRAISEFVQCHLTIGSCHPPFGFRFSLKRLHRFA